MSLILDGYRKEMVLSSLVNTFGVDALPYYLRLVKIYDGGSYCYTKKREIVNFFRHMEHRRNNNTFSSLMYCYHKTINEYREFKKMRNK
jgi:chloramphenicol O-acetyltransferase